MARGFEENVPKIRPRVRLGRVGELVLDEPADEAAAAPALSDAQPSPPGAEARADSPAPTAAAAVSGAAPAAAAAPPAAAPAPAPADAPAPSQASADTRPAPPVATAADERARRERLDQVRRMGLAAAEPLPDSALPPSTEASSGPSGRRGRKAAQHATSLARELSSELEVAAAANTRLKEDLDSAVTALRRAAEEARERSDDRDRLSIEVEKRATAARDLLAELELLEAERDGALAQVGRFSRELREARLSAEAQARAHERQKNELALAQEQLRRLAAELEARVAERDAARTELQRSRAEKEELQAALLEARAEADEALESRSALEEIERALGEARTRVAGFR